MSDLRTILGDKYDDVIEKASEAIEGEVDYLGCGCCTSYDYDEAVKRTGHDVRAYMAAHDVLAAVLPDLLAEANTRAEEAEAKARRFANLLANYGNAINATLPAEVVRQKAAAWDEGHKTPWKREPDDCRCSAWSSIECACGRYGTGRITTPNPYRQDSEGTEASQ
jgi:hypothetical protein